MSDMRVLELNGIKVEFRLNDITADDLDDLQDMISIFRRRFDRQKRLYNPAFVEAITGCLDAPCGSNPHPTPKGIKETME